MVWAGGTLVVAGGLAGAMAAAQLLPTEELTRYSIRSGGMSIGEASAFSLPPRELFVGLLPAFNLATPSSNEYLGWVGIGGLTLALLGLLFRTRRPGTLFFALVVMLSFLLALGNHFPLYDRIYRLPGMNLFRVPARWLMLTSLSLSMLGGSGLAFLRRLGRPPEAGRLEPLSGEAAGPWRRLAAANRLLVALVVVLGAAAALWPIQKVDSAAEWSLLPAMWLATSAAAVALAFWALAAAPSAWPAALFTAWVFVELFAASRSLEYNNPNPESVYTDSRPVLDALKADPRPERILSIAATGYQPSDADRLVAGHERVLGQNGIMATWINTKYKETLNPNLPMVYGLSSVDGYDGGVLPLRRYVELKTLFVPPDQNQPDALLRDQLRSVPALSVLRLLGVKYLVDDAIGDVTRDGVYYDLAGTVTLGPGERVRLTQVAALSAGAVAAGGAGPVAAAGIVTSLDGTSGLPDGAPVAQVVLGGDDGPLWQGTLLAGRDTAEGAYSAAAQHRQPAPLNPAGAGANAAATYLARLPVEAATAVRWVEVQSALAAPGQRVRLHAITLVGQSGESWPVTVAGDDALRLVHRSDVKLYRNQRAVPRAYVVGQAQVAETAPAALEAMRRPDYDPQRVVVLEREPGRLPPPRTPLRGRLRAWRDGIEDWLGLWSDPREGTVAAGFALGALASGPDGAGDVTIVDDAAERVAVRVEAAQPAVLVVRDTYYPGWSATVDGAPAPLWRADYLFQAVPVPAGRHVVELRFHSRALTRGLQISLLALLLTAALAFAPLPGRAVRLLQPKQDTGPDW